MLTLFWLHDISENRSVWLFLKVLSVKLAVVELLNVFSSCHHARSFMEVFWTRISNYTVELFIKEITELMIPIDSILFQIKYN